MKLQVLGCAGGIGGHERLTTCLQVDEDILFDAGTGLSSLDIEQLARIDHVFITHPHLDHVAGLAFLVDAMMVKRTGTINVYATQQIVDALKKYLFNWVLWPDFTTIPDVDTPAMRWHVIAHGATLDICGRMVTPYPVNHTDGSSAYWVHANGDGFLFTGDMGSTPDLWARMAQEKRLTKVIVDCSFTNADLDLANKSFHFCPQTLQNDVRNMPASVEFLIYHLKPGQEDLIMQELAVGANRPFRAVRCGESFQF
ncbi:MAG: 3',5'-cyclic-nucleotide phosphodiesterase [Burkholderiales bacterium]|nr:3',5'-cyclic-nucleotide phosphodiesterase [Burkholderiales bacterium]